MKVLICEFRQESNSFSSVVCQLEPVYAYRLFMNEGDKGALDSNVTELRGFYDEVTKYGAEVFLSAAVSFVSSGLVSRAAYDAVMKKILDDINRENPQIILIALHGAMIVEGDDDASGLVLEQIRRSVREKCVIAATVDMHANMTEKMLKYADYICGYKTYPHVDLYERGRQAASLAVKAFEEGIHSYAAMAKVPLIIPAESGNTEKEPVCSLMKRAEEIESSYGVQSVTVSVVQPWLNVQGVGCCATVYAVEKDIAEKYAQELALMIWEMRGKALIHVYTVEEAVRIAMQTQQKPLLFVHSADTPSAGSAGDSSAVIKGLYEYGKGLISFANLVDPVTACTAVKAGEGAKIKVKLGFGIDPAYGKPFESEWLVRRICPETFVFKGPMYTGNSFNRGKTAVLENGKLSVVVMENSVDNCDPELYRSAGLQIEDADIVVVRSPNGYRSPYKGLYSKDIVLDTPGASNPQLEKLPFNNTGWEIYPVNKSIEFIPKPKLVQRC